MPSASKSSSRPISGSPAAQNQLDGFGGLDHADQARQNAEHAAFGARGNQARRRRLGIEAAIARPVLGREHAGLAFETENRAVDVRFASQHAGVVDQVAGWEIVGAVGDDVVFAEDVQRVFARESSVECLRISRYGIDSLQLLCGGIELLRADIRGAVNDLPLKIRIVHNVEVNHSKRADARRPPDKAPAASPARPRQYTIPGQLSA